MSEVDENGIEDVFGGEPVAEKDPAPAAGTKKAAPKKKAPAAKADPKANYTKIKLSHSKDIPPSGLYIGHNGKGYLLKPGIEADVPDFLLDVLDNAVMKTPVIGSNGSVQGWEDQPRFMYSIVRKK